MKQLLPGQSAESERGTGASSSKPVGDGGSEAPGKNDLLMRFFESEWFDAWIALTCVWYGVSGLLPAGNGSPACLPPPGAPLATPASSRKRSSNGGLGPPRWFRCANTVLRRCRVESVCTGWGCDGAARRQRSALARGADPTRRRPAKVLNFSRQGRTLSAPSPPGPSSRLAQQQSLRKIEGSWLIGRHACGCHERWRWDAPACFPPGAPRWGPEIGPVPGGMGWGFRRPESCNRQCRRRRPALLRYCCLACAWRRAMGENVGAAAVWQRVCRPRGSRLGRVGEVGIAARRPRLPLSSSPASRNRRPFSLSLLCSALLNPLPSFPPPP